MYVLVALVFIYFCGDCAFSCSMFNLASYSQISNFSFLCLPCQVFLKNQTFENIYLDLLMFWYGLLRFNFPSMEAINILNTFYF